MNMCEFWKPVIIFVIFEVIFVLDLFRDYFDNNGICFHSELKVLGIVSYFLGKQLIVSYRLICWEWPWNLATLFGWNAEYATHIHSPDPHISGKFCVLYPKWRSNQSHVFCSFRGVTEIARWSVEYIVITFWIVND